MLFIIIRSTANFIKSVSEKRKIYAINTQFCRVNIISLVFIFKKFITHFTIPFFVHQIQHHLTKKNPNQLYFIVKRSFKVFCYFNNQSQIFLVSNIVSSNQTREIQIIPMKKLKERGKSFVIRQLENSLLVFLIDRLKTRKNIWLNNSGSQFITSIQAFNYASIFSPRLHDLLFTSFRSAAQRAFKNEVNFKNYRSFSLIYLSS